MEGSLSGNTEKGNYVTFSSRDECLALLEKVGCSQDVIEHSKAVARLAVAIATRAQRNIEVDMDLVEAGALLHDIGRSRTQEISHGIEGAKVLREKGYPEALARIAERHIGAGITKEDAPRLGLPEMDLVPRTLEEKIVAHADNLIDFLDRRTIKETVDDLEERGLPNVSSKVLELHQVLCDICKMDIDEIPW